ncbi:MAG: AbrB/MazE/SpoVT family DNA-binding domain-containing protein [Candidatus Limiplasma sp.]|nr:AbrB/MazE/SpoVT family DNA-binding domain-containing protein [Candidatus Limiplasma sp.]
MKSTGIVRKLDNLGRIVLPIEMRKTMGIGIKDGIEIFADGNTIVLRKYEAGCIFCGEARDTMLFRGKRVCGCCMQQMHSETKGES